MVCAPLLSIHHANILSELTHLHLVVGNLVSGKHNLSDSAQAALLRHYNSGGIHRVHHYLTRNPPRGSTLFRPTAVRFYEYILLDGRRIVPTTRTRRRTAGSSLVKVTWKEQMFAGVVKTIFHHDQPRITEDIVWAEIDWMKHLDLAAVEDDPWSIV